MKLVLLSRDLMLSSRIDHVARKVGYSPKTYADLSSAQTELADEEAKALFLDLQLPGLDVAKVVESARDLRGNDLLIVGCGPHVHEQRLEEARQAGCDRVVSKGQFDRDAENILRLDDE